MDDEWIYGSAPENIYTTIVAGAAERHALVRAAASRRRRSGSSSPTCARSAGSRPSARARSRTDHMMMYPGLAVAAGAGEARSSRSVRRRRRCRDACQVGLRGALTSRCSSRRGRRPRGRARCGGSRSRSPSVGLRRRRSARCAGRWRARAAASATARRSPADGERRMTRGVDVRASARRSSSCSSSSATTSPSAARSSPCRAQHPLTIEVTGHQWWWEVTYADTSPHGRFTTANEIHVPVGEPVLFLLDVARRHPQLLGAEPRREEGSHSRATRSRSGSRPTPPGVYRGQCAEFCGLQHAKMALYVVAEPPARVPTRGSRAQRQPAASADRFRRRRADGRCSSPAPCAMCHAIEGTPAGSHVGPDLTHLASRRTIAAGTLPNTRGTSPAGSSIRSASSPATHMPPNQLQPQRPRRAAHLSPEPQVSDAATSRQRRLRRRRREPVRRRRAAELAQHVRTHAHRRLLGLDHRRSTTSRSASATSPPLRLLHPRRPQRGR